MIYLIDDNITYHAKQGLFVNTVKKRLRAALGVATFTLLFFIAQILTLTI